MLSSNRNLKGILLMCQSSFGFSAMALCVKFVSRDLPSLEIVFFRGLIGSFMLLAIMSQKKIPIFGHKKQRKLMILRGLTGFAALSLHFYTIAHLPLGTAVMLNYTAPIFAALFSIFLLKERPGLFLFSMIFTAFAGVYLLVGASVAASYWMSFLGLVSAVFVAFVYILISAIGGRESPLTIIFYFTMIATLGSIFFLPFGFKWPGLQDWLFLLGLGIASFFGQLWLTESLSRAPASLVSPFSYLVPLLSFVYGLIFFGEKLTNTSCFGAFLIIFSGCLISWWESRKSTLPPEGS